MTNSRLLFLLPVAAITLAACSSKNVLLTVRDSGASDSGTGGSGVGGTGKGGITGKGGTNVLGSGGGGGGGTAGSVTSSTGPGPGTGGTGMGGTKSDSASVKDGAAGAGGSDAGHDVVADLPIPIDGGTAIDPCSPPAPVGYHTVHFRYIWAGQKTFTFFPKPESMPKSVQLQIGSTSVSCVREMDRPWFACQVPDTAFTTGATWLALDPSHTPAWDTKVTRAFPSTPGEYWVRWHYGRPDVSRSKDPPTFLFYDHYPDAGNGNWAATGAWNDSACTTGGKSTDVGFGGWFPYQSTQHQYPYGGSLASSYPAGSQAAAQAAIDAFVFERYQLWKQNYVKYDSDACGTGTARVANDYSSTTTYSEGQGYGVAMSAAMGDKELFDKLWKFVRNNLTQSAKTYCGGLMGWTWSGPDSCRPLDTPCDSSVQTCSANSSSQFDGDVDIGIGLVYAAQQWPAYKQDAIDWLVKMECEVNTVYDGKWNYPSLGDINDKTCSNPAAPCSYVASSPSAVQLDYYPPGYFRVFGDFLAARLGSGVQASNGQTHHDFWYKTAETVYQMLELCYDEPKVDPAFVANSGTVAQPCIPGSTSGFGTELRASWRISIDGAWFGNNTSLPENKSSSSSHYSPKSRMQAKIDNIQELFGNFSKRNPVEANANRFSTICSSLNGTSLPTNCDPTIGGHDGYRVNMGMCAYATDFDNSGSTTVDIRREAVEEAISTAIASTGYYNESLAVYSLLFLSGNFPNPTAVPVE